MSNLSRHLSSRWTTLTSTRTATITLRRWGEIPELADVCDSWNELRAAAACDDATAAALVRLAHDGDELAHLTLLVAASPRLTALVMRRRAMWTGPAVEMFDDALSVASIEILRPSLKGCGDRVVWRILCNVDWQLFRQPAQRRRIANITTHPEPDLQLLTGAANATGRPIGSDVHACDQLEALLERALKSGVAASDVELVRRRVLYDDFAPLADRPARTNRFHVHAATHRFIHWATTDNTDPMSTRQGPS